jgi:hypothetical protein
VGRDCGIARNCASVKARRCATCLTARDEAHYIGGFMRIQTLVLLNGYGIIL